MAEIRRIYDCEGAEVAALWDRMCRETPDGGPLSETGRRNIARMLDMSAWHHETFCLVAVEDGRTVGFVNGRVNPGDGLLPCPVGEIDSLYVVPESRQRGLSRELAGAAVSWLRDRGAGTIYTRVCADAEDVRRFWQSMGFEADMIHLSLYRE